MRQTNAKSQAPKSTPSRAGRNAKLGTQPNMAQATAAVEGPDSNQQAEATSADSQDQRVQREHTLLIEAVKREFLQMTLIRAEIVEARLSGNFSVKDVVKWSKRFARSTRRQSVLWRKIAKLNLKKKSRI